MLEIPVEKIFRRAGRLVIDAVTGIGSGAALETAVGSVDLDNTFQWKY